MRHINHISVSGKCRRRYPQFSTLNVFATICLPLIFSFFVFSHLFFAPLVFAEIYRWVDADGNVHYGDRPQQASVEKVEVDSVVPSARRLEAEKVNQHYQQLYQEFKRQDAARLAQEKEKAAERKERELACSKVDKYARVANKDYAFYKFNEDGSRAYLTDEEIAAYREKVNSAHKKYCLD